MHISVLQKEIIQYLEPRPGENFIDGTCGGAGHSIEVLKKNAPSGKVLCLDLDSKALAGAEEKIRTHFPDLISRIIFVNENFADLERAAKKNSFAPVSGIIADLGMSSDQLEDSGRGFSFQKDEPLDMRFSEKNDLTAAVIVNQWNQADIEKVLRDYGEERFARKISEKIIAQRKIKPILKTGELVKIISQAVPKRLQYARIHYATRSFQGLRIAVNDELGNLERLLFSSLKMLERGGRLAIISFHSLEDRMAKNFFREQAKAGKLRILTKKPVTAGEEEISVNPRSRSAKLRVGEKI